MGLLPDRFFSNSAPACAARGRVSSGTFFLIPGGWRFRKSAGRFVVRSSTSSAGPLAASRGRLP